MTLIKEKLSIQKYLGKYRAFCVDNVDPKKLGRIKMVGPEIFGLENVTDWAFPVMPILGPIKPREDEVPATISDLGFFSVPNIDARIWAEFEAGDPDRPIYVGYWYAEPEGTSEVPVLAKADIDEQTQKAIGDETTQDPKGTDGVSPNPPVTTANNLTIQEPLSPYDARYPQNRVWKTKGGIVIELDDTVKDGVPCGRIHIWHPTGTYDEIRADGSRIRRVQGDRYLIVELSDEIHIKGTWHVVIDGDATLKVGGDYIVLVEGNKTETIKGNYTQLVEGNKTVTVKLDYAQTIEGDKTVTLKKNLTESVDQSVIRTVLITETDTITGAWSRNSSTSIKDTAPIVNHN